VLDIIIITLQLVCDYFGFHPRRTTYVSLVAINIMFALCVYFEYIKIILKLFTKYIVPILQIYPSYIIIYFLIITNDIYYLYYYL
jgi:hypothetical protein